MAVEITARKQSAGKDPMEDALVLSTCSGSSSDCQKTVISEYTEWETGRTRRQLPGNEAGDPVRLGPPALIRKICSLSAYAAVSIPLNDPYPCLPRRN